MLILHVVICDWAECMRDTWNSDTIGKGKRGGGGGVLTRQRTAVKEKIIPARTM